MSRQKFEKTFNTFTKGLMTEASELNFPEDFSLYEKNFLLRRDGGRDRRKGMELVYPIWDTLTLTSKPYVYELSEEVSVSPLVDEVYIKDVLVELLSEPEEIGIGPVLAEAALEDSLLRVGEEVSVGPVITVIKPSEIIFQGEEIGELAPIVLDPAYSVLYEFAVEEVSVSPIISEVELI